LRRFSPVVLQGFPKPPPWRLLPESLSKVFPPFNSGIARYSARAEWGKVAPVMKAHEFFYGSVPGNVSLADAVWAARARNLALKVLFTPSDRFDVTVIPRRVRDGSAGSWPGKLKPRRRKQNHRHA
jgi:hypothetical protein